jgi:predicted nucleic acid-binding protein
LGLIYLDTCLLIYLVEQHPIWYRKIRDALEKSGDYAFGIPPLVQLECLVGPLRQGDGRLQRAYEAVFQRFLPLELPASVYIDAAEIRARSGLRTPDALHLACAKHHECAELWTNDDRLQQAARGLARNVIAAS